MDEIQKVLIKAGRKDLAQKYYEKVAAKTVKKPLIETKTKFDNNSFDWKDIRNAKKWIEKLRIKGFKTYVLDDDDQYFLYAVKNGTIKQLADHFEIRENKLNEIVDVDRYFGDENEDNDNDDDFEI